MYWLLASSWAEKTKEKAISAKAARATSITETVNARERSPCAHARHMDIRRLSIGPRHHSIFSAILNFALLALRFALISSLPGGIGFFVVTARCGLVLKKVFTTRSSRE